MEDNTQKKKRLNNFLSGAQVCQVRVESWFAFEIPKWIFLRSFSQLCTLELASFKKVSLCILAAQSYKFGITPLFCWCHNDSQNKYKLFYFTLLMVKVKGLKKKCVQVRKEKSCLSFQNTKPFLQSLLRRLSSTPEGMNTLIFLTCPGCMVVSPQKSSFLFFPMFQLRLCYLAASTAHISKHELK